MKKDPKKKNFNLRQNVNVSILKYKKGKNVLIKVLYLVLGCFLSFAYSEQQKVRNIYLDLGAFMGDTLNMFELMNVHQRAHQNIPWEIFSFEASPLLAHQTQLVTDALNRKSKDLPVNFDEIKGMKRYVYLASSYQWNWNKRFIAFFDQFEELLLKRESSRGSYTSILNRTLQDIHQQLKEAKVRSNTPNNHYTAFACGVGPEDSFFEMKWHSSNYMNGGGNVLGVDYGSPKHVFHVPVIDLSKWIIENFSKNDYIYVKMDIEGMEFLLVKALIESGALDYVDEMDIEWHGRFDVPGKEWEQQLKETILRKNIILRDHY